MIDLWHRSDQLSNLLLQRGEELRSALFSFWHRAVHAWNKEIMASSNVLQVCIL